ncbi:hypothetical protein [Nocardia niwae]|uniref:Uncharacterized protein n=1 Tax=Nocardia niwae TaxID=626084 RepID=A0ABV2XD38_9NOCA|nr:hypothetical protein [Nocardia niwae]
MGTTTGSGEVVQHFTSGGRIAKSELEWWTNREGCRHVAETVLAHVTSTPYAIASKDIVQLQTSHALGNVKRAEAEEVGSIRDWFPDFAFTHLFHLMLEEVQRLFSWDEFYEWCQGDVVRRWLWEPAREMVASAKVEGFGYKQARDAMRWRIGNFYYSFLRELYVIAALRERGLPMRFHPLADALFRADAWCENVLLELYIGNRMFKSGDMGRKSSTEEYFSDQPQFEVVRFEMRLQRTYGKVHVPPTEQINQCAALVRRAMRR